MPRDLRFSWDYQVFLNYPFDTDFVHLAIAMNFAVVAGGLLPVSAYDLTEPDKNRLDMIAHAVRGCMYSIHDLSRHRGEGAKNFARMNMPLELGMALFHVIDTQKTQHRCAFSVAEPHEYRQFISDLAGLDPIIHRNEDLTMLIQVYEWLRRVVPSTRFNSLPVATVTDRYAEFKEKLRCVRGSGANGAASHEECREVMYRMCGGAGWWDWRNYKRGREEFPEVPVLFIEA